MSPKDQQIIENSRDINHARQIIAHDLEHLKQMMLNKKCGEINVQCTIHVGGAVAFLLYAAQPSKPFGKDGHYQFCRSDTSYDEAYNKAVVAIKDIGSEADKCAPWFDMKVYQDAKDKDTPKVIDSNTFGTDLPEELRWPGPDAPPAYWYAVNKDGVRTKVYRSYADYCDD